MALTRKYKCAHCSETFRTAGGRTVHEASTCPKRPGKPTGGGK